MNFPRCIEILVPSIVNDTNRICVLSFFMAVCISTVNGHLVYRESAIVYLQFPSKLIHCLSNVKKLVLAAAVQVHASK